MEGGVPSKQSVRRAQELWLESRAHADDACAPRLLMLRKDIFGKVWGYASSAYSFVAGAPAEAGPTPPPALRFFLAHISSVSGSA